MYKFRLATQTLVPQPDAVLYLHVHDAVQAASVGAVLNATLGLRLFAGTNFSGFWK